MKTVLFLLLIHTHVRAQSGEKLLAGFDPNTDFIADNYEAGPYLIYDCEEKHWTCVIETYFKDCQDKRTRDMASEKITHSCAPFRSFPTKKSCFQRQLFLTTHNQGTRFCLKDQHKHNN